MKENTSNASERQNSRPTTKAKPWTLIGLCVFAVLLWGANWFFVARHISSPAEQGQFGDMFGAVNALFTALAFAGLIYTVLLQVDAQNTLFEKQKAFQEEQRQKQIAHDLKLEELRQSFEGIVEGRRKDREREANEEFARNVLRAIRRELEAVGEVYDRGIGAQLSGIAEGQLFLVRLAITQDWFTIFNANSVHFGKLPADTSRRIIAVYAQLKSLIEEFRINNEYISRFEELTLELRERPREAVLQTRRELAHGLLVSQAKKLRSLEQILKQQTTELYALLDQQGIN